MVARNRALEWRSPNKKRRSPRGTAAQVANGANHAAIQAEESQYNSGGTDESDLPFVFCNLYANRLNDLILLETAIERT
jgi:hypothetical protein